MELTLAPEHGFLLLTLVATVLVHNGWMTGAVNMARKKYTVAYPALYAPAGHKNEKEFNCIQRGHQNSLENLPSFYASLLVAGAKFPIAASIAGAVYLLGRIMYFMGYSTGTPDKRLWGSFMYLGSLALLAMIGVWAVELLKPMVGMKH